MTEWTAVALVIIGILDMAIVVALFYVGAKASRIDHLEETVTAEANKAINTRFDLLASEFKGLVTPLRTIIEAIEKRLERGDAAFDRQEEFQRKLELRVEQTKSECQREFATRSDLSDLSGEFRKLEVKLARFEERIHNASEER